MIGIVVVSHSPALARAAVDLALEMVGGSPPPIAIAAGAGEGIIGTDATKVAAAIDEVSSPDGVLVFMDLGSAVLSATMALEFAATKNRVRLSDAPFVEGLLAGVVLAGAGAGLDEVEREAHGAMDAKRGQLSPPASPGIELGPTTAGSGESRSDLTAVRVGSEISPTSNAGEISTSSISVKLINPDGLHSRPAAAVVKAMSTFDAKVTIENLTAGKGPVGANSLIGIMSLGAKEGDVIRFTGSGAQAAELVEQLRAMAADGFGEL